MLGTKGGGERIIIGEHLNRPKHDLKNELAITRRGTYLQMFPRHTNKTFLLLSLLAETLITCLDNLGLRATRGLNCLNAAGREVFFIAHGSQRLKMP